MDLVKLEIYGINNVYEISAVEKEFKKAVNEKWRDKPPWKRYQRKLIENLAVLEQEKERAIELPQFEKLVGTQNLYCIRYANSPKNVRVVYTIYEDTVILLYAFLEKNESDYQNAIFVAKRRLKWLND